MLKNVSFALVAAFWVVMNTLLWRSEMGAGHNLASTVPPEAVWERILTAPDDSSFSIFVGSKKAGFVRWRPNVGEEAATGKIASENEPEGIVRKLTEYTVEIEGSFVSQAVGRSLRFTTGLKFDPQLAWKEFETQVLVRPAVWKVRGNAETGELWLHGEEDGTEWIRRFTFDQLRSPQSLLEQIESPLLAALLGQQAAIAGVQPGKMSLGLNWTARYEWLRIGSSRVRVYRLRAKVVEGQEIDVLVSRVGELLKVELPFNVRLVNETLFET
jgi:hypothetical protein